MADYCDVFTTGTFKERHRAVSRIEKLPLDQRKVAMNRFYDRWVLEGYEGDILREGYVSHITLAKEISAMFVDRSVRLLDCASGSGLLGLELKNVGFTNIDALDSSRGSLDESKTKNVYTNFICAFLGPDRLPIEDDQYDGICLTGAFGDGHVLPNCLPEWVRITKPGGFILFVVREETLLCTEGFCDGVLETVVHKMAAEACWEFLQKKRLLYWTGKEIQYSYIYVLKVV